jgi:hypothetical protein
VIILLLVLLMLAALLGGLGALAAPVFFVGMFAVLLLFALSGGVYMRRDRPRRWRAF